MVERNTVDDVLMESVQDDAALAPEGTDALSEVLGVAPAEQNVDDDQQTVEDVDDNLPEPESKALKGRMKAYEQRGYKRAQREAREAESKWAEKERSYQERLAKYERMELEAEAKEFAQKNNVPEKFALEYLQMKKNSGGAVVEQQPRSDDGRFASAKPEAAEVPSEVRARAASLMAQAEAFEKVTDGQVGKEAILDAFQNDPDVHSKVVNGEWDFTDVGKSLMGASQQAAAPRAVRSPNSGKIKASTFANMSDEEFSRFNDRIAKGAVFDARR